MLGMARQAAAAAGRIGAIGLEESFPHRLNILLESLKRVCPFSLGRIAELQPGLAGANAAV
jgi:hypothetical protein